MRSIPRLLLNLDYKVDRRGWQRAGDQKGQTCRSLRSITAANQNRQARILGKPRILKRKLAPQEYRTTIGFDSPRMLAVPAEAGFGMDRPIFGLPVLIQPVVAFLGHDGRRSIGRWDPTWAVRRGPIPFPVPPSREVRRPTCRARAARLQCSPREMRLRSRLGSSPTSAGSAHRSPVAALR